MRDYKAQSISFIIQLWKITWNLLFLNEKNLNELEINKEEIYHKFHENYSPVQLKIDQKIIVDAFKIVNMELR